MGSRRCKILWQLGDTSQEYDLRKPKLSTNSCARHSWRLSIGDSTDDKSDIIGNVIPVDEDDANIPARYRPLLDDAFGLIEFHFNNKRSFCTGTHIGDGSC